MSEEIKNQNTEKEIGQGRFRNPFSALTRVEWIIWIVSFVGVMLSFLLVPERDYLTLCASLVGVTALIFVAKGMVFGQAMVVVFSVFYGIISFFFAYYGEMITYVGMSAPMAIFAIISWLRHPYKDAGEVEVGSLNGRKIALMLAATAAVTVAFYFILGALDTENLVVSTVSVTTSFLAAYLTFLRSPYYALAYAANDIVLIVLWVLAAIAELSYLPMVVCFSLFFINDIYGFINWQRMKSRQRSAVESL